MTDQTVEIDPERQREMEKEARLLIAGLRPNKQFGLIGILALIVGISTIIALIKIPFDNEWVWDSWAIPSIVICLILVIVCIWCCPIYSAHIDFDHRGFRLRRWIFGIIHQYDWNDVTFLRSVGLEHRYRLSDDTILKTMNNDDFGNSFYSAYAIFESRFSLIE